MDSVLPTTQPKNFRYRRNAPRTVTITDNRTGNSYELPITHDTIRAMDLRQIKVHPKILDHQLRPGYNNAGSPCRRQITLCMLYPRKPCYCKRVVADDPKSSGCTLICRSPSPDGVVVMEFVDFPSGCPVMVLCRGRCAGIEVGLRRGKNRVHRDNSPEAAKSAQWTIIYTKQDRGNGLL